MASATDEDRGADLSQGVLLADFDERGLLRGHVGEEDVLLARVGDEVLAVGARCTHYGGPLAEGIVDADTVRCPWHHACFSLRSGEALAAPAFDPLTCWKVERDGDRIVVRKPVPTPRPAPASTGIDLPRRVLIVGGGAAGFSCAERLRHRGYRGRITLLSDDNTAPCDRPNLSKDYLAGQAEESWIPLRPDSFYADHDIELQLQTVATRIGTSARSVLAADGRVFPFDRLLLATGAEPMRPPIPGADQPHVFTLRSLDDSRSIIAQAGKAKVALILGSGFIGLEVAASLRTRGLEVHVVSHDARPLERVLGAELGEFVRTLHERHGVVFHPGRSLLSIGPQFAQLDDGTQLRTDLVVVGVGVQPRVSLAETAGLAVDNGVLVDPYLATSDPGIYAAGDVARWRDAASGQTRRVEHWVVAERQGQVVAENMLGARIAYRDAPFFWSAHYDVTIRYVGHAPTWDTVDKEGSIAGRDCLLTYRLNDAVVALAAIGRDAQLLQRARALSAVRPA